ncbi:MAG: FeoB-associated Cys-rich membrane protein [Oscillospiraceae bacterium]|nr:FeoB-associated Cys-rich membrane protein [Oscillospiraceae bacterium]
MWSFFVQNWGSLLVAAILAAVVAGIIFKLKADKKKGTSSCGCNCGHCPSAGVCHTKPRQ